MEHSSLAQYLESKIVRRITVVDNIARMESYILTINTFFYLTSPIFNQSEIAILQEQ